MNYDNTTDRSPGTRSERRHRETRDEILREARRLVGQRGAAGLSMREVAKNTSFTPPALYRYFPGGKDEMLEALATSGLQLLATDFARLPADLPPREHLLDIAMAYLEFAREHRGELYIILDSAATMEGRELDEVGLLGPTGLFRAIEQALSEAADVEASMPDELALIFLHGLWSLVHGMAVLEPMQPHLFRTQAREVVRAYLNGFTTVWPEAGSVLVGTRRIQRREAP